MSSLTTLLDQRAGREPERVIYTFVDADETRTTMTYADVRTSARRAAASMQQAVATGERVLLLYPTGADYIAAFFGCLYAGLVPVPAALPKTPRDRARVMAIARDAQTALVLTTPEELERAAALFTNAADPIAVRALSIDTLGTDFEVPLRDAARAPDAPAYVQYTSGSTSSPKGVIVTQACLLHNLASIDRGFAHSSDSVSVNWLPHFHDMGLVYGLLQPLCYGFRSVQLAPATFVQQPIRWLRAMTAERATHSGGPNFAYDLCLRRTTEEEREGLDLRAWRVAFCGAEPVRHRTVAGFQRVFAAYGFRPRGLCPAYGLAEATLKVSGGDAGAELALFNTHAPIDGARPARSRHAAEQTLVGCGRPGLDTEIRIVSPATATECPPGEIGEVWVNGPGVAAGYWNRPLETASTFHATLEGVPGRSYLRTGDLGFVHDGELFIAGRLKDMMIVRGQNVFAEDVELVVADCHPAIAGGATAAFSIEIDGREEIVVVQERSRQGQGDPEEAIAAVADAIAAQMALIVYEVVLVRPGKIPKTSSGKVQRQTCRAEYLTDSLELIHRGTGRGAALAALASAQMDGDSPVSGASGEDSRDAIAREAHEYVMGLLEAITGAPILETHWRAPLVTCGIDSLKAAHLQQRLALDRGIEIELARLLDDLTPAGLDRILEEARRAEAPSGEAAHDEAALRHEPPVVTDRDLELSFEQERLWLADRTSTGGMLNLAGTFTIRGASVRAFRRAVDDVLKRHRILRTGIQVANGRLRPRVVASIDRTVSVVDLRAVVGAAVDPSARVREVLRGDWTRPFDLSSPPLVRVRLVMIDDDTSFVSLCAHHLVCDLRSLELIASELASRYEEHRSGTAATTGAPTFDFFAFAALQHEAYAAGRWAAGLDYWRECLRDYAGGWTFELAGGESRRSAERASFTLDAEGSARLRERARQQAITPFMLLLAASASWLRPWSRSDDMVICCPVNGRHDARTTNAIGPFAYPIPIRLRVSSLESFAGLLQQVKAATLAAYEHQDVPFSKILEVAPRTGRRSGLARVMCNLIALATPANAAGAGAAGAAFVPEHGPVDIDLHITWIDDGREIRGELTGTADYFPRGAVQAAGDLAADVLALLDRQDLRIGERDRSVEHETRDERGAREAHATRETHGTRETHARPIAIAATFTADGVAETVRLWLARLGIDAGVVVTPNQQVFQALLDPASVIRGAQGGLCALLVRLHDWALDDESRDEAGARLARAVDDFVDAVKAAAHASTATFFVCFCPDPDQGPATGALSRHADAEQAVARALAGEPNVIVTTIDEVLRLYPVAEHTDAYTDRLAAVPYVPDFLMALGTLIARRYVALSGPARKLLVLDCDQTLWSGVCAELPSTAVTVDAAALLVQRVALAKRDAGMLLCLCSKNSERDVWAVFQNGPGMLLRAADITAWRVNWQPKPANVLSLAEELAVDVDSMVIVDDDAVECAGLRAACPRAAVLQLPADRQLWPRFLDHAWPLDVVASNAADRQRAEQYAVGAARRREETSAPSLADFLERLQLEIQIDELQPAHLERVAQLTTRTTQMNVNPVWRTAAEVRQLHRAGETEWRVIHVRDRFGEYGLVGVLAYTRGNDAIDVDTFLLSCRALGRGVEHHMLRHLGGAAAAQGVSAVRFTVKTTHRNEPARLFLSSAGARASKDAAGNAEAADASWTIPVSAARAAAYVPRAGVPARDGQHARTVDEAPAPAPRPAIASEIWQEIASAVTPDRIAALIGMPRRPLPSSTMDAVEASVTERVSQLWAGILQIPRTGLDEDFFAAGGHSMLAIELAGSLKRAFDVEIPVETLFSGRFTVREVARAIERERRVQNRLMA